jgi:hypothetical protein
MCGGAPHQISDGIHAHHAQHTLVVAMPAVLGALMLRRRACIGQQPTVLVEARGEPVSHERDGPAYIHDSQYQVLYRYQSGVQQLLRQTADGFAGQQIRCSLYPQATGAGRRTRCWHAPAPTSPTAGAVSPAPCQPSRRGAAAPPGCDGCMYLVTFAMIRTEDGLNRNVRESQSLIRYLS